LNGCCTVTEVLCKFANIILVQNRPTFYATLSNNKLDPKVMMEIIIVGPKQNAGMLFRETGGRFHFLFSAVGARGKLNTCQI
jgi:hypothetical protein